MFSSAIVSLKREMISATDITIFQHLVPKKNKRRVCEHGARPYNCRKCSGCPHGQRKSRCILCGGVGRCSHGKLRFQCRDCGGGSICRHGINKALCVKCDGVVICVHKKRKTRCKTCDGRELCKMKMCEVMGNRKYDGYCTHCFSHLFPSDKRTPLICRKTKELAVVAYIAAVYDAGFSHDKCLYVDFGREGCCTSKRRIDLRKLVGNTLLCVEIDEHQHKSYDVLDEERRYNNLFMDFSGKYVFIRYNPDSYTNLQGKRLDPSFTERMQALTARLDMEQRRIEAGENTALVEIHKMYFDYS